MPHLMVMLIEWCITTQMKVFIIVELSHLTGQVGLEVGSWTSNLTNAGSIPVEFD